jgi:drug/metabolite transporter (DMT)-like permease
LDGHAIAMLVSLCFLWGTVAGLHQGGLCQIPGLVLAHPGLSGQQHLCVQFLTPIFGILLGGLLLQEPLTAQLLLGGALVTGGMALVNWPGARIPVRTRE